MNKRRLFDQIKDILIQSHYDMEFPLEVSPTYDVIKNRKAVAIDLYLGRPSTRDINLSPKALLFHNRIDSEACQIMQAIEREMEK
ncbi:MAG: hypothetical protein PHQ41_10490 [Candidatus Cloacimonetes bacterium]|jgi:hypothetical protein|nr:hypothetical protein [Candidatus Cloacimonadota bacterium]